MIPKTTEERLAELLAKRQLSPAEMEEFVSLQNKRVLEPQRHEFVSKHQFSKSDMVARLQSIEWFEHCGQPVNFDLTMPTVQVANWVEATTSCNRDEWENTILAAHNQLSGWLHVNAREKFQKWNEHNAAHKAIIKQVAEGKWEQVIQRNGLDRSVLNCIHWDVLGAMMENAYIDQRHHCFFSLELFKVYEGGHFPCGWAGKWPEGYLVVY